MCSLKNGVLFVGALFVIVSIIICATSVAVFVTFENHASACLSLLTKEEAPLQGMVFNTMPRDTQGLLPECHVMTDTAFRLSSRIFMTVQIVVWVLLLLCSILLMVGAAKRRAAFVFPWLVLVILVMGSIIYDLSSDSHKFGAISTIIASAVLAFCAICSAIVIFYLKSIKNNSSTRLHSEPVTSVFMSGFVKTGTKHGPVFKPVSPAVRCEALSTSDDLPPDYDSAVAKTSNSTGQFIGTSKPTKIPSGLGMLR